MAWVPLYVHGIQPSMCLHNYDSIIIHKMNGEKKTFVPESQKIPETLLPDIKKTESRTLFVLLSAAETPKRPG